MVPKKLEKIIGKHNIWRRIETIEMTARLKSDKIIRKVLETCGDLLLARLSRKKNSQLVIM